MLAGRRMPEEGFARSAMNYWVNCTTLTRTASPTWLRPLRRISGCSLRSTAITAVICTREG